MFLAFFGPSVFSISYLMIIMNILLFVSDKTTNFSLNIYFLLSKRPKSQALASQVVEFNPDDLDISLPLTLQR